jgi:hypothetical protein
MVTDKNHGIAPTPWQDAQQKTLNRPDMMSNAMQANCKYMMSWI